MTQSTKSRRFTSPCIALYSPYPQCGKSTFSKLLKQQFHDCGSSAELGSFADPLRGVAMACIIAAGYSVDQARRFVTELKDQPVFGDVTGRSLLIGVGDGARAHIDPDIWVKSLEKRWRECRAGAFIIDDLRRPNELKWLQERHAVLIKVSRPFELTGLKEVPPLENLLDTADFDYEVVNDGDILNLQDEAMCIVNDILDL